MQTAHIGDVVNGLVAKHYDFRQEALEHLDSLYNLALYLTKKRSEAGDLVQETYLRAFRFSHRFEPGTRMRAWLFQILRNTFLTNCRVRERETPYEADSDAKIEPMFHHSPNYGADVMDVHTDLERSLKRLPEDFRTSLILSEIEGMPLEEVAMVMECPIGTVKSRVFRAKEKMREYLSDYEANSIKITSAGLGTQT